MIKFTFSDGTVIESAYITDSLTITRRYHNKLNTTLDSARLTVEYSEALANKIKSDADNYIYVQIYYDDDIKFTGYLRKTFTFNKTQKNQPIALEVVSVGDKLNKECDEAIVLIDTTVAEILETIYEKTGVDVRASSLVTDILCFVINEGDNFQKVVDQLLFEMGYSYDFAADGTFVLYPLFNLPESTVSQTFNGTNCLNQITVKQTETEFNGCSAKWQKKELKQDTLLYEETEGQSDINSCSVEIKSHEYMYSGESEEDFELQYGSSLGKIIHVVNAELDADGLYLSHLQTTFENRNTYAYWKCYNPTTVASLYTKFRIYGDAYIATADNITKTTNGTKLKEIELKYLNDDNAIQTFVEKVADYYRYSQNEITVTSKTDYAIGSFVTVTDNGMGTYTGRIIAKTYGARGTIGYIIESIDSYQPAEVATRLRRKSNQLVIGATGAQGPSGYNTRTIQLFKRSDVAPSEVPDSFTLDFTQASQSVPAATLKGWGFAFPEIDDDGNPCWEIHCTVISVDTTVVVASAAWSTPAQISKDTEITKADVQQMINDSWMASAPVVYADTTYCGFIVDNQNKTVQEQSVTMTVHVMQTQEEIDFQFGEITLPTGWHETHSGNQITFTVDEGTVITHGNIAIPVVYYPYLNNFQYADEDDNIYEDENSQKYGFWSYADTPTIYNIGFGYSQVKGGIYHHSITTLGTLPANPVLDDYFTWNGTNNTASTLCKEGSFKQGAVYRWNGEQWEIDTDNAHMMGALTDVLSIASADLNSNNSQVVQLFQRISAQQAIINNLIVTGSALVQKLQALDIYADRFTSLDNASKGYADDAQSGAVSDVYEATGLDELADKTIIEGSKIKTGLIDADNIFSRTITMKGNNSKIQTEGFVEGASSGFKIDGKNGKLYINNGDFSGSLRCEPINIIYDPYYKELMTYTKVSTPQEVVQLVQDLQATYRASNDWESVGSWFGRAYTYIKVGDKLYDEVNTGDLDYTSRTPQTFAVRDTSTGETLYIISYGGIIDEVMRYSFKLVIDQKWIFKLSKLPNGDPGIKGLVYVENGNLKVSL